VTNNVTDLVNIQHMGNRQQDAMLPFLVGCKCLMHTVDHFWIEGWLNHDIIMAALWNRAGHYIFALWFLSLWSPYVIGQAAITLGIGPHSSSSFFLLLLFLA